MEEIIKIEDAKKVVLLITGRKKQLHDVLSSKPGFAFHREYLVRAVYHEVNVRNIRRITSLLYQFRRKGLVGHNAGYYWLKEYDQTSK